MSIELHYFIFNLKRQELLKSSKQLKFFLREIRNTKSRSHPMLYEESMLLNTVK